MTEAKQGDTVRVHYTGKLGNGEVFDSSQDREPLEFTVGSGEVIPGFDEAVTGMSIGENKSVTLDPERAYGEYRSEMVHKISRTEIPDDMDLEVGMMVQAAQPNNERVILTVTEMDEKTVTLDANHPLAGKELTFDIQLVEIVA